jgi:hypothetical protein
VAIAPVRRVKYDFRMMKDSMPEINYAKRHTLAGWGTAVGEFQLSCVDGCR